MSEFQVRVINGKYGNSTVKVCYTLLPIQTYSIPKMPFYTLFERCDDAKRTAYSIQQNTRRALSVVAVMAVVGVQMETEQILPSFTSEYLSKHGFSSVRVDCPNCMPTVTVFDERQLLALWVLNQDGTYTQLNGGQRCRDDPNCTKNDPAHYATYSHSKPPNYGSEPLFTLSRIPCPLQEKCMCKWDSHFAMFTHPLSHFH